MKNEKDIFLAEPADWNYKYLIDVKPGYLGVSCLLEVRDLGLRMGFLGNWPVRDTARALPSSQS